MQTNIDYEISQLRDAVFGEDVRSAFISCMENYIQCQKQMRIL